ncbi:hypothetical protein QWY14_04530 [Planococcus sp. N028]|uniref:Uncharacterized protein n=1 Tax=Planococcus shixiaomingii TaxID=3058393 RepID=A0ABT8N026_9BACL|nr:MULTISPECIES: hypothetical protein [unclassified Planococcus (in: firmicutes)]MDN7241042.1 hypothetical protein [Planococcus sp. N028]WKA53296.1 hypothetical protein QWY21_11550 [Planococcus sp. N022]
MPKKFNLIYHFVDGDTWGGEEVDVHLAAEEISAHFTENLCQPDVELVSHSTNEKKTVKELKSVELVFRW